MKSFSSSDVHFLTLLLSSTPYLAQAQYHFGGPCSIYGADYPPPQNIASSPAVIKAIAQINKALNASFTDSEPYGLLSNATAFSLDLYSVYETEPLFTYHYTSPAVAYSTGHVDTNTTFSVDSDSIYRVGSISKLLTVYVYLLEAGDVSWNEPITKYIPELANITQVTQGNRIDYVDWSEITIGALASHLAGVGRLHPLGLGYDSVEGLPEWPSPDEPAISSELCNAGGTLVPCNRTQYFESYLTRPPVVPAFETPIYSNNGIVLLGYALETITGVPLPTLFQNWLNDRLDLSATSYYPPNTTNGVYPLNTSISGFTANLGAIIPIGGYYSSTNDMRAIGKSILNSSFLSPAQTRRWLKPHSFTADPRETVGAPWEIIRAPASTTGKLTWVYTKSGDVGAYAALMGLMPEYGVGFTILSAWTDEAGSGTRYNLGNIVMDILYPALEKAAKAEATTNFAGTYHDEVANSTIVITSDQYTGFNLSSWTYNGTDARAKFLVDTHNAPDAFTRLIPTGLNNVNSGTGKISAVSFRLVASSAVRNDRSEPVSSVCESWQMVDLTMYGRQGLDSFVFEMGLDGRANGINAKALGVVLDRVG